MELIARYIESTRLDSELNVVSGVSTFISTMESLPVYKLLYVELSYPGARLWVSSRICKLLDKEIDPTYSNPYDTAITIYLHALITKYPTYFQVMESAILDGIQLWYAPKVLYRLKDKFGIEN